MVTAKAPPPWCAHFASTCSQCEVAQRWSGVKQNSDPTASTDKRAPRVRALSARLRSVLEPHMDLVVLFDAQYLEQWLVVPLEIADGRLRVATVGTPALEVLQDLEDSYGLPVELVPVSQEDLLDAIRRAFRDKESTVELVKDLEAPVGQSAEGSEHGTDARDLANQPPVIRYVNFLIREARDARASDIHLEYTRDGTHARFRIDGVLSEVPCRRPQERPAALGYLFGPARIPSQHAPPPKART